jgi:glycosyltransferase involved in cell wall biosynthesis
VRVLLSAYACLPNAGTEPGNGWNWAVHLAERGIDVHVLTVVEGRDKIEAYRRDHPNPRIQFSYVDIPTKRFKECSGMHYALWQWCAVKVARALQKTERFDIAHHVTYGSIHVPSQLWRVGIPVVFGPVGGGQTTPSSMLMHFGEDKRSEQFRTMLTRALPYSPLHRAWLRKMSAILATNQDTLELIHSMGRSDVKLQFDAALPESFLAPQPRVFEGQPKPIRLLWVGTMHPRKALPLTLDILANVDYPSTLTIIGDGRGSETLRQMIEERGLTERVIWAGKRLPWDDVRAAYLEHDAMLFTSLRDSCACQLLESMALGLPVITLDLHGARNLVPDAAGIKVPLSADEVVRDVAMAVVRYAKLSGAERTAMSIAGWEFARSMTWNVRAAEAEQLYRKILLSNERNLRVPAEAIPDQELAVQMKK